MTKLSRTERLLALVLVLLSTKRALTRSEIRAAVRDYPADASQAAFERMFERDKDELRGMGIPIEAVEVDEAEGTGYRLATSKAFLAAIELDPAERVVLALASRTWEEATWGHDSLNALRKLELAGEFTSNGRADFALTVRVNSVALTTLLDATETRQRVEFDYRKAGSPVAEKRTVEPWGVVAARGQWYLVGHDVDRAATRAFRLSRVRSDIKPRKPANSFEIPAGINLHELVADTFPGTELIDVRVRLTPGTAARLRSLATSIDGDVATLSGVDPDRILPELLSPGAAVQVLAPESIQSRVVDALRTIAESPPVTISAQERASLAAEAERAAKAPGEAAAAQVSRLLALVPWLLAHPGVAYEDAAEHFGVSVGRLRDDLSLAVCTEFGSNLLTLDIDVWDTRITVHDAQGIDGPLSLTRSEAISLLIGLRLLEQVPGPHERAALASVIHKIERAAGDAASLASHVSVPAPKALNSSCDALIATALKASRALKIRYWSASRDEERNRVVDPIRILNTSGATYLEAWCREAEAVRLFRVDRIQSAELLEEPSQVPDGAAGSVTRMIDPQGPIAIIEVDAAVAWWAGQVPSTAVLARGDGSVLVSLPVASDSWAVRTALGFAGQIRVVEPAELAAEIHLLAADALRHYSK